MNMKRLSMLAAPVALTLVLAACTTSPATGQDRNKPGAAPVPFKAASLIVETNATDGDAGLQVFLDHEPWKSIAISRPDGTKILDVKTRNVLESYGLTELFSESSEPPFTEFPLEEFMKLFPEGEYKFVGETIDGVKMQSTVTLTHDFPAGPEIVSPEEDSTVSRGALVVRWEPVTEPAGIQIVGYQVVVSRESPERVFEADMPATATELRIPAEFLEPGVEYKVEVLAIEVSGNQTLTEITFSTR
jgi:hypothetical protein